MTKKKQKRLMLTTAAFIIAAIAITLIMTALNQSIAYFYTPADLSKLEHPPERTIRLGGLVEAGSVQKNTADNTQVTFVIADDIATTPVSYKGILPDLFREGQGVVVQGRVLTDGSVEAFEVLAKHDENYMPREVADALKEQGRWKEDGAAAKY